MAKLPIAVIGAGQIGRTHIDRALRSASVELVAIADPTPAAPTWRAPPACRSSTITSRCSSN